MIVFIFYLIISALLLIINLEYYKTQLEQISQGYQKIINNYDAQHLVLQKKIQCMQEIAATEKTVYFLAGFIVASALFVGITYCIIIPLSNKGDDFDPVNKLFKVIEIAFSRDNSMGERITSLTDPAQEMLTLTERIQIVELECAKAQFKLLQLAPSPEDSYNLFISIITDSFNIIRDYIFY